jgi:hypothetical protein
VQGQNLKHQWGLGVLVGLGVTDGVPVGVPVPEGSVGEGEAVDVEDAVADAVGDTRIAVK